MEFIFPRVILLGVTQRILNMKFLDFVVHLLKKESNRAILEAQYYISQQ